MKNDFYDVKDRYLGCTEVEAVDKNGNEDNSTWKVTMQYSEIISRLKCLLKFEKVDGLDAVALQGAIYVLEEDMKEQE